MKVSPNARFVARRRPVPELARLPLEERAAWIARDRSYANIVCRCEEVSEGEIRAAISPRQSALLPPTADGRALTEARLQASSLDAVKRRTRAGMGRCHGGFCTPRVMEIVSGELGIPMTALTKKGSGSRLVEGETKSGDTLLLASERIPEEE